MRDLAEAGEPTAKYQDSRGQSPNPPVLPMLTIVYHPDVARIGEYALLPELDMGREVLLSRLTLEFSSPDRSRRRALGDSFVSRKALRLSRANDCYRVEVPPGSSTVSVDGTPIAAASYSVPCQSLAAGVLLCLAGRIVLLWECSVAPPVADEVAADGLLGYSAALAEVRCSIARVGPLETDVLILGESGTGKELVASAIHKTSHRSAGAWVPVNMSAIPSSLCSSELFGSVKGAFTGADRSQPGYFVNATGGTLFLDEVGDAPMEVQTAVLRALESREIQPVGGKPIKLDLRIISATDADLDAGVRDHSFKTALRHRLSCYEIRLPPLRARRSDIGVLARHFFCEQFSAQGEARRLQREAEIPEFVRDCATLFALLTRYDWPGNVRELRNAVKQIAIDNSDSEGLSVPAPIAELLAADHAVAACADEVTADSGVPAAVTKADDKAVRDAMAGAKWVVAGAARSLGMTRQSVYRRIERDETLRRAMDLSVAEVMAAYRGCDGDVDAMSDRLQVSASGLQRRLQDLI